MSNYQKNWKTLNHKEEDSILGNIVITLLMGFVAFLSVYGFFINL